MNAVLPKGGLDPHVREVAEASATNAPLTIAAAKRTLQEITRGDAGGFDGRAVDEAVRRCFESEDYREGVRAFLEKRRPAFQGR